MDLDTSLYEAALEPLKARFLADMPVISRERARELAVTAVDTLVTEGLLTTNTCDHRDSTGTPNCDNEAPLTWRLCFKHGNQL